MFTNINGLKTVTAGSKLAVKLKNGKTVKEKFISVSDATLSLSARNKPAEINQQDVRSVHQMSGTTAKKATLIGAGVGAAIGAGLGVAAANEDEACYLLCMNKAEGAAIFGVPGAGIGALLGFVVGKIGHKRVLVYQAKQP